MQAPTATELLNHPAIRLAIEEAWTDSLSGDPARRHEEGGWIYADIVSGDVAIRRAATGGRAAIDLRHPTVIVGSVVVGKFHTHPNQTGDGWTPGPSDVDLRVDALHGVPDLIRADNGLYVSGPNQRRGGLGGEPGYPA